MRRTPLALISLAALAAAALTLPGSSSAAPPAAAVTPGFPTVDNGLEFGASLVTDPQRSQGESAAFADGQGVLYSCGTNGASNGTAARSRIPRQSTSRVVISASPASGYSRRNCARRIDSPNAHRSSAVRSRRARTSGESSGTTLL